MTAAELITWLTERGIKLWVAEGRLRYRAPGGVMLPALRSTLEERRSELIAELESCPNKAGAHALTRVSRDGRLPLSLTQQRLWRLHKLDPKDPSGNVHAALRLTGSLDSAALERAVEVLVQRHEILRTVCEEFEGGVCQRVMTAGAPPLLTIDLSERSETQAVELARRELSRAVQLPFDLMSCSLLRVYLARLSPNNHVLLVSTHQFIMDGWGMRDVFLPELAQVYTSLQRGEPPMLEPLEFQYADYAAWQNQSLTDDTVLRHRRFWQTQLSGAPHRLHLGTDRPRSARPDYRSNGLPFTLPVSTAGAIRQLAKKAGATPFMVLAAALAVVLYCETGEDDIVICTSASNRSAHGTERMLGSFANILLLRMRLQGGQGFGSFLERVRDTAVEAYTHQDVPLDLFLGTDEGLNSPVPLQVLLLFHRRSAAEAFSESALEVGHFSLDPAPSKFAWKLELSGEKNTYTGESVYSAGLFEREHMMRLKEDLFAVIERAAADPETPMARLTSVLSDPTRIIVRPASPPVAPRDHMEEKLLAIWQAALGNRSIGIKDDFFEWGGSSLIAVNLFSRLEKEFGLRLPLSALLEAPTAEKMARRLRRTAGVVNWSCIVPLQSAGRAVPFFCVHPEGGNVICLRALALHLAPDHPFFGIQSEGLGPGRTPHHTIHDMAVHYVAEIRRLRPQGPYRLGGTCMGGLVALEMARLLSVAGETVERLVLIDTRNLVKRPPSLWRSGRQIAGRLRNLMTTRIRRDAKAAEDSGSESVFKRVQRANAEARSRYAPHRLYHGPIDFIWADATDGPLGALHDPTNGWQYLADSLAIHRVPCHHLTMLEEPCVRHVAEALRKILDRESSNALSHAGPLIGDPGSAVAVKGEKISLFQKTIF